MKTGKLLNSCYTNLPKHLTISKGLASSRITLETLSVSLQEVLQSTVA